MAQLYICHPPERYVPGLSGWVSAAVACAKSDDGWNGWKFRVIEYDLNTSLKAQDLCAEAIDRPGPIVLLQPVQKGVVQEVRARLTGRLNVFVEDAFDALAVGLSMEKARTSHENGDPQLPRNYVIALLLLRKLDQERMWAGNSKGYMWVDDIRKGRGLDEKFADGIGHVLNVLSQADLLTNKPSGGIKKYANNPKRREEIYDILCTRRFSDWAMKVLSGDRQLVSARELDLMTEYVE